MPGNDTGKEQQTVGRVYRVADSVRLKSESNQSQRYTDSAMLVLTRAKGFCTKADSDPAHPCRGFQGGCRFPTQGLGDIAQVIWPEC